MSLARTAVAGLLTAAALLCSPGAASGADVASAGGRAKCSVTATTVTTGGLLSRVTSQGTMALVTTDRAQLTFYPRALTEATAQKTADTSAYYAVAANGHVWRVAVRYPPTGAAKVRYQAVGAWGASVRDLSVSDSRLYTLTTAGVLQRRTVLSTGALGAPSTIRTGLTSLASLSAHPATIYETNAAGTPVARYDLLWGVTTDGRLQQHIVRYLGKAGVPYEVVTVARTGWGRFDSVDVGMCSDLPDGSYLMGRDLRSANLLTYVDRYLWATTDGLEYTSVAGRLTSRTFGA